MSAVLEVFGLQLQRGLPGRHRIIVAGIDCRLAAGEVLMLVGPNGAGKSTLLAALAGDLTPSDGVLCFGGRALQAWSARDLARHRAVLTQHIGLMLDFTVEEVVQFGCMTRALRPAQQAAIVERALAALALGELRGRTVPSLSGGEQARVHLARVLAQLWPEVGEVGAGPRLLLLDEPCASLDPRYQHQVCGVVRQFARDSGAGVVLTMHDMNLAAQYADRVMVLARGRCLADGAPREVFTPTLVRECFGVEATLFDAPERLLLATHVAPAPIGSAF